MAFVQIFRTLARNRRPDAPVPQHHRAATIFGRRDRSLERRIGKRVIFGPDRKALVLGVPAWSSRHRPAFQHAVDFKPKIEVQSRCIMFLNHEGVARTLGNAARWFFRFRKVASAIIIGKRVGTRHGQARFFAGDFLGAGFALSPELTDFFSAAIRSMTLLPRLTAASSVSSMTFRPFDFFFFSISRSSASM